MRLSEFKEILKSKDNIAFELPNGQLVASHFHVTEVGSIKKHFIDCGGTVREENKVNFQLWEANDYDHRLHPEKLLHIIDLSETTLGIEDHQIEVEYQGETIGKFALGYEGDNFLLLAQETDCLAKDNCGIEVPKKKLSLASISNEENCCAPGGGCC